MKMKQKGKEASGDGATQCQASPSAPSTLQRVRIHVWNFFVTILKGGCVFLSMVLMFKTGVLYEQKKGPREQVGQPHAKLEVLSWRPRIFLARDFLSKEEADHFIGLGETELGDSQAAEAKGGQQGARRTSSTAWLQAFEKRDAKLSAVLDRAHELARVPRQNGEPTSITQYRVGELYGWHHDTSEMETRMATVLIYLRAPEGGGETVFPFAHGGGGPAKPPPFNPAAGNSPNASTPFHSYCEAKKGQLKIAPRTGDAVLFFSHHTSLKIDFAAWHASCPVTSGTKWAMQRWMKSIPFAKHVERHYNMTYAQWEQLAETAAATMLLTRRKSKRGKASAKKKGEL